VCAVCGKNWCGFWGSECVLFVGEFGVGLLEKECAECGRDFVGLGSECVLCVGEFVVGLGE